MASNAPTKRTVSERESTEVEKIDEATFDILDNVTEVGTLAFEFSETKNNLALRKNNGQYVPLELFREHAKSVSVTDISASLWCELQVEFSHLHPYLQTTSEWTRRSQEGRPVERRKRNMMLGKAIHYQKEIEIRKPVEVKTLTKEDLVSVDIITTLVKLHSVAMGNTEREIKVMGRVTSDEGRGLILSGIIDQLQYTPSTKELVIQEMKTRTTKSLPEAAQKQGVKLQVNIYKILLDSLTQGCHDYADLLKQKGLKIDQTLSQGPVQYLRETKLVKDIGDLTLNRLASVVTQSIKALYLPLVDAMIVQYVYQGDLSVLGEEPVGYEEAWSRQVVLSAGQYWRGEREARGVDMEDCWKCSTCQFREVCVWRRGRELESSPVKKWPTEFYPSPKKEKLT